MATRYVNTKNLKRFLKDSKYKRTASEVPEYLDDIMEEILSRASDLATKDRIQTVGHEHVLQAVQSI